MLELIQTICGVYSLQYQIRLAQLIELIFCIIFYTLPFRRRNSFWIRLACGLIFALPFLYPLAVLRTLFPGIIFNILVTFILHLYIFGMLILLYQEALHELLLCLCTGIATQIIVGRVYETLLILFGKDAYADISLFHDTVVWRDWTVYFVIHLVISFFLSILFRRKEVYRHDTESARLIVIFSLAITIISVPVNAFSRTLEGENHPLNFIIRIFSVLYGLFILFLRMGILEQSKLRQDLKIMDELLYVEKKQFEDMRSDIEIINIKCHDIRHQLSQFEAKLTEQELDSLKSAIQIYDSNIKTGSEILDVILFKKQLLCEKNHIHLSCIADGKCLSFITPSHLYSLLSNAIENAFEAVQQVENDEKRVVSISIRKENGLSAIHVTNYFNGTREIEDGLLLTSKEDKAHHGFGVKSMRYITELYHGSISFSTDQDIFYLHIFFPGAD
ncbi:ATP-binding protein [Anaerobium acetethylicum]|uniref:GHKL domain-containing protein n=1 Tax=Anaerobium acetethylicum TaxID=1619234 RepID=A0A1D3TW49_9FIRM|nr:ATP-binding protein [Anaerobium acetethylicum]SCP98430.1 GHKL domain-containing protein [Anaerobium acetethylicum]